MSVSILMVRALVDAVESAGVPRARLLAEVGLPRERLEDPNGRLSLPEYDRVQLAALTLSGDPALGLHLGENAKAQAFDVLGHLASQAPTLRDAIDTILRYSRLVSLEPVGTLQEEGDAAWVRFPFPRIDTPRLRMAAELSVSGFARLVCAFGGPGARLRAACFTHAAPPYRAEYTRVFDGSERFEQPFTGLEFDRAWLARTQLHTSPELHALLEAQAERALGRLARDGTLATRVLGQLVAGDPKRPASMDEVARALDMSPRSLRRKLAAESGDFRQLAERARMLTAMRMLERGTIQETAFAMGFATPAAFHRAFKRWTGKTPKQYKGTY